MIEFRMRQRKAFILVLGSGWCGFFFLHFGKTFKFGKFAGACLRIVQFAIDPGQQIVRLRRPRIGIDRRQEFVFCFLKVFLALIALPKENVHLWHVGLRLLRDHQEW